MTEVQAVADAAFSKIAGRRDNSAYAENQVSNRPAKGAGHDLFEEHIDVIELEGWFTKANLDEVAFIPMVKTKKAMRRSETLRRDAVSEFHNEEKASRTRPAKHPSTTTLTKVVLPVSRSMPQLGRNPNHSQTGQRTAQRAVDRRAAEREAMAQRDAKGSGSFPPLMRQPAVFDRSEWNPLEPSPSAFSSDVPLRPRRTRIKPILTPIRPLDLPFVPKRPSDEQSGVRLVEGGDEEIAHAEKQYALLCVDTEQFQLTSASCSYEMRHATRRLLRDKSAYLCRTYNALGVAYTEQKPEMAHALLLRARTCAAATKDASLKITTLGNIGVCWLRRGSPSTATTALRQAMRLDVEHPHTLDLETRTKLRLNLCAALCQLGSHADALEQAKGLVTSTKDPVQLALALHNVCVCHEFLQQPAKALAAAERALKLARAHLPEDDHLLRRLEQVGRSLPRKA